MSVSTKTSKAGRVRSQLEKRGSRWQIIPANMEKATKQLGINKPVKVLSRAMEHWEGRQPGINDQGEYVITLNSKLRSDCASRILWHELIHVVQSERLGEEKFDAQYDEELEAAGFTQAKLAVGLSTYMIETYYQHLPFESEAFKAEQNHETLPLCENKIR